MKSKKQIRKELAEVREEYLDDMKWLRETYGIIPEPEEYLVKRLALSSVETLIADTPEALTKALEDFRVFHKSVIYHVAWDLLERSKESIKIIENENVELYERKLKQWELASWSMTRDIYRQTFTKFKETIKLAATI